LFAQAVDLAVSHRLLRLSADRPEIIAGLLKADAAARRIQVFVQNLLGFSRLSPPVLAPVSLAQIVEASLPLVEHELANRDVEIVKDFEPGAPLVKGDANALKQVFINLVVNALQAMDAQGHGKITIKVYGPRGQDSAVAEVTDTGPGIPAEIQQRLFEPFFTTKKSDQGTGLGLYIIQGIIERHQGSLVLESAPGKGTTFRLTFPKA
jgi:signal transduction histidine kinase